MNNLSKMCLRFSTQSILSAPIKDKYSILMEDDKLRAGASSMQGWRSTMEDAHAMYLSLFGMPDKMNDEDGAIAAVFDGHRGSKFAQSCASHIREWVTSTAAFRSGDFGKALRDAFILGDEFLHRTMPNELSGCTGNCVLIIQNHLYCANAGDSRSVLCRDGVAIPLSDDHKPTNPLERARIERAGGYVHNGRVNSVLSLSRAFGDFAFKKSNLKSEEQIITVVPYVLHIELTPLDEFVIIACDGVWDTISNEEAVEFVRNEVADHGDISLACERMMNTCLAITPENYGTDNMTVLILQFKSSFLKKVESKFV
ncbi:unnamed protein product [Phytomonas sp. Hart1]|nr:unnamed protein product [Phytomonas sp. Hart1]|eukprot:CCW70457.1 unnamed protein product [Phytomonas sp. isolate Hart1]